MELQTSELTGSLKEEVDSILENTGLWTQNWDALYNMRFPPYLEVLSPGDMGSKMRVVIASSGSRLPTDAADVRLFASVHLTTFINFCSN